MKDEKLKEIFRSAIENEIEIDRQLTVSLGIDKLIDFIVPRPLRFASFIKSNTGSSKLIAKLFWTLWNVIFSWLIFTFKLLTFGFKTLKAGNQSSENLKGDLIIGATHRVDELMNEIRNDQSPKNWLILPWTLLDEIPVEDNKFYLLKLLSLSDLFFAFRKSISMSFWFSKVASKKYFRLQTYIAFELILLYRVLDKKSHDITSFWYANHYDRWAILLDQINIDVPGVLIQHGFLSVTPMPVRMKNVKRMYYTGITSKNWFVDNVLDNVDQIEFIEIKKSFPFQKVQFDRSIMVICQPTSTDNEILLIKRLSEEVSNLHVLVKPHPLYSPEPYLKLSSNNIEVILDKKKHFDVSLAVTDNSWLGMEYESCGMHVIWMHNRSLNDTFDQIKEYIETQV